MNAVKHLLVEEDIAYGEGTRTQNRGGVPYNVTEVRSIWPTDSLASVDPTKHPKVALISGATIAFYAWDGAQFVKLTIV